MGSKLFFHCAFLVALLSVSTAFNPWDSMSHSMKNTFMNIHNSFDDEDPFFSETDEKDFNPDVVTVDKPSKPSKPFSIFGIPRMNFKMDLPKPWWKGPNVCTEKETIDDKDSKREKEEVNFFGGNNIAKSTSCRSSNTLHICTTKVIDDEGERKYVVKHRCCPGFKRDPKGPGCLKRVTKPMTEVLKDLNCTRFLDLATTSKTFNLLNSQNITVFCPVDKAMIEYDLTHIDNSIVKENRQKSINQDESRMVLGHIVPDYLVSEELYYDAPILMTANNKSKIRINSFSVPYHVLTANCVPLMTVDHESNSGIVHLVEQVIPMPTMTLAQLIDKDPQLSLWKEVLKAHKLYEELGDPKSNFTMFAPTNKAFENQSASTMEKLKSGSSCLGSIVRSHLVNGITCMSIIRNDLHVRSLLNKVIAINRDDEKMLQIDSTNTIQMGDIMATNGVLHVVTDLIIPDEAKPVTQMLEDNHYDEFVKLIDDAGLREELDSMTNFTLFVPAKRELKKWRIDEIHDKAALAELVHHHLIPKSLSTFEMNNGQRLNTVLGDPKLHIGVKNMFPHSRMVSVECQKILEPNYGVCGGKVHIIEKVLIPSKNNLKDTLEELTNVDHFMKLLNFTGLTHILSDANDSYTILVPTNQAFYRLSPRYQRMLENDKSWAKQVAKMHILPGRVCGIFPTNNFMFMFSQSKKTINGHSVQLSQDHTGTTKFGTAKVIRGDLPATNGIIQVVNRVIAPPTRSHSSSFADQILGMFL